VRWLCGGLTQTVMPRGWAALSDSHAQDVPLAAEHPPEHCQHGTQIERTHMPSPSRDVPMGAIQPRRPVRADGSMWISRYQSIRQPADGRVAWRRSAFKHRCAGDMDGYSSRKLKISSSWFAAVLYSGGSVHVRVSKGSIHHDTVQPGRDCGIAVHAGGAVGLFPEDVCVSDVPSGFFDHVDVDPP
jgi:hypothetical protein